MCPSCFDQISYLPTDQCVWCNSLTATDGRCENCVRSTALDGVFSACHYTDTIMETLIHEFKFNFIEALASDLTDAFMNRLSAEWRFKIINSVVMPIPLHPRRLAERGFNQSEILAKEVVRRLGANCNVDSLVRSVYTDQQAKLTRAEREKNVSEAFKIVKVDQVINKDIVLVDDVITTGATMNAAATALKAAGARKVFAISLAHE